MINDKDKVKMFEMRVKGGTYEQIGHIFNITRERVRQILKDAISRETTIRKRKNDPDI